MAVVAVMVLLILSMAAVFLADSQSPASVSSLDEGAHLAYHMQYPLNGAGKLNGDDDNEEVEEQETSPQVIPPPPSSTNNCRQSCGIASSAYCHCEAGGSNYCACYSCDTAFDLLVWLLEPAHRLPAAAGASVTAILLLHSPWIYNPFV